MEKKKPSLPALRFLLPAAAFLGLAVFLLLGLDRNPDEIPSPLIDKPAPAWRLARLAGAPSPVAPTPAGANGTGAKGISIDGTVTGGTVIGQRPSGAGPAGAAAGSGSGSGSGSTDGATRNGTSGAADAARANVPAGTGLTSAPAPGAGPATLDSAQLRGQPYLLNVWASWCLPCLQEHPQLLVLARMQQIRLVGMNYKDAPADASAWLRQHGNPFDDIVTDPRGRAGIDFGVYGVPETFLIDGDGHIRFKHTGVITPEVLQHRLLPAIAALKGAPSP